MLDSTTATAMAQPRLIKKGCERCGGDLFLQSDKYGEYFGCLQCGSSVETRLRESAAIEERRGRRSVERASI